MKNMLKLGNELISKNLQFRLVNEFGEIKYFKNNTCIYNKKCLKQYINILLQVCNNIQLQVYTINGWNTWYEINK